MPLPSAPPLAISDIAAEFGAPANVGLAALLAGGAYVPSGTTGDNGPVPSALPIAISDFYGASADSDYDWLMDHPDWSSLYPNNPEYFPFSWTAATKTINHLGGGQYAELPMFYKREQGPVTWGLITTNLHFDAGYESSTHRIAYLQMGLNDVVVRGGWFLEGTFNELGAWYQSGYTTSGYGGKAFNSMTYPAAIHLEAVAPNIGIYKVNGEVIVNEVISGMSTPSGTEVGQASHNAWPDPDQLGPFLDNWTLTVYG